MFAHSNLCAGFWLIIGWILGKKIFTSINKHLLNGEYNAYTNVVIYVLDFLIFLGFRPFRDTMVSITC